MALQTSLRMGMRLDDRVASIRFGSGRLPEENWVRLLNPVGLCRMTRLDSALNPREIADRLPGIGTSAKKGSSSRSSGKEHRLPPENGERWSRLPFIPSLSPLLDFVSETS